MATPNFCPSCGAKLDGASFCPNCGTAFNQFPPVRKPNYGGRLRRLVFYVFLGFGVLVLIGILASSDDSSKSAAGSSGSPPASDSPASSAQAAPAPTDADLKNAQYLDEHYEIPANAACDSEADDYLRTAAKYDYAWDKTGIFEEKFDSYAATVKSPGVLTLITNKVKLQNGFGAYQHVILTCDYNTQTKDRDGPGNVSYSIELPPDDQ